MAGQAVVTVTASAHEMRQIDQAAMVLAAVVELIDAAGSPTTGYVEGLARTSEILEDLVTRQGGIAVQRNGAGFFRAGVNEHVKELKQLLATRPR